MPGPSCARPRQRPDNEVLIFSGTGDKWIAGFDPEMAKQPLHELPADAFYDQIYADATNC